MRVRRDDIKIRLLARGLTLREAARRLGMSYGHLTKVVGGFLDPSPDFEARIERLLANDPDQAGAGSVRRGEVVGRRS
jgi:transcriptional regulator with XRE-family HTH domain